MQPKIALPSPEPLPFGQWLEQNSNSPDRSATARFLAEFRESLGTLRTYAKECDRLLLWLHFARHKGLTTARKTDYEAYLEFLKAPEPAEIWCGIKCSKQSPNWRPFEGKLGAKAQIAAIGAIGSLLGWLVDDGYLQKNPLSLLRRKRKETLRNSPSPLDAGKVAQADTVDRFLDSTMWGAVLQALEALPESNAREIAHRERMRFVLNFLYYLAPRVGELASHRMNCFQEKRGQWWWSVLGKGQKWARVPMPDSMVEALLHYRKYLGLPPCPDVDDDTPLLQSIGGKPITARHLNRLLKTLFEQSAAHLPSSEAYKATKLLKASAHWGRHTAITAMLDSGIDPRYVRKSARHADMRTTELYLHEEDTKWHEQAQKTSH